jgi:uncharacterized protein YhbP (UPF0306 family)
MCWRTRVQQKLRPRQKVPIATAIAVNELPLCPLSDGEPTIARNMEFVMPIEQRETAVHPKQIATMARQLLEASTLCSIASVCDDGRPHINTVYFACNDLMDVFWMSEPEAQHSQNVRASGAVAIAVYDSNQPWGTPGRGIQLFGQAEQLEGEAAREAKATYRQRFAALSEPDYGAYRFYRCKLRRVKLFDERVLGDATFVTARINQGGEFVWERTDGYRS